MACGCAGSTPRQERQQQRARVTAQQQRPRRGGGPGQPGYTWEGPRSRTVNGPAPKQA